MTDQNKDHDKDKDNLGGDGEVKKFSQADMDKMIDERTAGLRSKVDELLGEKKTASQKQREAEAAAAAEREKRAKDDGDHKALFESSEQKRGELQTQYDTLRDSIRSEKRNGEALKISSQLASGDNVGLLSEFVARRVDVNDDGKTVVLNEDGSPSVLTLDELKTEIEKSGRFNALLDGPKSSGGGASRTGNGGAGTGTDISKMSREQKKLFYRQKRAT